MTEKKFDRRYIETLYSANYFGSTTDYSDEEIERNQERWIEAMKLLGWNLGDTILVEFDHAFKDILNVDKEDEFEKACEKALEKITRPDESEEFEYESSLRHKCDITRFTKRPGKHFALDFQSRKANNSIDSRNGMGYQLRSFSCTDT